MLRMAQIHTIKDLWENEELSLREIARITQHSFKTVKKYAYQEEWNEEKQPDMRAESYPVLGAYIEQINAWVEADRKVPRKQRHTAWRIYRRLCEEHGYTGSYSSVRRYMRKKQYVMKTEKQGYLPLEQAAGSGQVDFGSFQYYDAKEEEQTGYALVMSFPRSNKAYIQAFPSQNQECLLEGLKRIFEHMGGVPERLRFDNMTTAVARILKDGERVLTEGFSRFMLHYRFQAEFCNPGSGNEKGHVENKVGYSRRNAFVPVPNIHNFEEYNAKLWEWCEKDGERVHYMHKRRINELWEEERTELLALPEHPYSVFRYETLAVNKNGFVSIETNRYGLSPSWSGEKVQAKIYFDHIAFYHEHREIARFERCYGSRQEIYDWTQYVATLCRKPGAVEHTRFFRQMPEQWQTYLEGIYGKERKSALRLLEEMVTDGNAGICEEALQLAKENGRMDADSVRQCYYLIAKKEYRPVPLSIKDAPAFHYDPNLHAYDGLTGGLHDV